LTAIVLDASAALHVVMRLDGSQALTDVLRAASTVVAPRLFVVETANALWKYVRAGHLSEQEAVELLQAALSLVTHPIDDSDLAVEALSTATRFNHPVYDALYATLARRLGGAVATRDRRLRELLVALRIDSVPSPLKSSSTTRPDR
jgi:predicted nucleic acid-binding protein